MTRSNTRFVLFYYLPSEFKPCIFVNLYDPDRMLHRAKAVICLEIIDNDSQKGITYKRKIV